MIKNELQYYDKINAQWDKMRYKIEYILNNEIQKQQDYKITMKNQHNKIQSLQYTMNTMNNDQKWANNGNDG